MYFHATLPLTIWIKKKGIHTWDALTQYVQQIPYGRTSDRSDLRLVLTENRGTCSSKHALLKEIAEENQMNDIRLMLGMYRMNAHNTPGIGDTLEVANIPFVPEAHCYLNINGQRYDFTSPTADIKIIEPDILEEFEIQPEQIGRYKVAFHQKYMRMWGEQAYPNMTFDELWALREACIARLST